MDLLCDQVIQLLHVSDDLTVKMACIYLCHGCVTQQLDANLLDVKLLLQIFTLTHKIHIAAGRYFGI